MDKVKGHCLSRAACALGSDQVSPTSLWRPGGRRPGGRRPIPMPMKASCKPMSLQSKSKHQVRTPLAIVHLHRAHASRLPPPPW
eukprot:4028711-Prymnesium_polylepis.1